MIDKITAKIRRYPFQTGIVLGVLFCLLCVGFFSLFQDHGRSLAGNSEIIQQDYLRMTINEYGWNNDELLAQWRYEHLGKKSDDTLKLMRADESLSVSQLVSFAKAIGQEDKLGTVPEKQTNGTGTPVNPRKGLSGFGKVLLIVLGLVVAAAGGLYVASLFKTKTKQKRRSDSGLTPDSEPINMITPEKARAAQNNAPDTLFDLDSLFPQTDGDNDEPKEDFDTEEADKTDNHENNADEDKPNEEFDSTGILFHDLNISNVSDEEINQKNQSEPEEVAIEPPDDVSANDNPDTVNTETDISEKVEDAADRTNEPEIEGPSIEITDSVHDFEPEKIIDNQGAELPQSEEVKTEEGKIPEQNETLDNKDEQSEYNLAEEQINNKAEKPLIETEPENDSENEDELLKIIRGSAAAKDEEENKKNQPESIEADNTLSGQQESVHKPYESKDISIQETKAEPADDAAEDDILIHYQSVYRIGNDMYDEVFSIDQGDVFRGECGIGIGETLNNTEPKAVTAFEVWLFDKDDIHTATWYLMSDFALDNDGISKRLEQRGKCDRIRKNDVYVLETETLTVEIKVLELEYGTEMEEKNSYFTNVVFDVIARQKLLNENAN